MEQGDARSNDWLLIRYEQPQTFPTQTKTVFIIIPSTSVIDKENLYTGKSINFRMGHLVRKAIIYLASDDLNLLVTEMRNMRKTPLTTNSKNRGEKRKRIEETTIDYSQPSTSARANEVSNENSGRNVLPPIQPMMYDQYTQTSDITPNDPFFESNETLQTLRELHAENQILHNETRETKQVLQDLTSDIHDLKTMITDVHRRIQNCIQTNNRHVINDRFRPNNEPVVLYTNSLNQIVSLTTDETHNNVTTEVSDGSNGNSNYSSRNSSRRSVISDVSTDNLTLDTGRSSTCEIMSDESGHTSIESEDKSDFNEPDENVNENVNENMNENVNANSNEDLSGSVKLGKNGTTVPRACIDNIQFNSHSHATRRLLTALFSRDVLATHSLTGKPSPAFMDLEKPTKNGLDPKIIEDIVEYVTDKCKVTATAVRSAITTKCADENKMLRLRNEKKRNSLQDRHNENNGESSTAHNETI